MNPTKEQLQERAQLVRVHEANCAIQYPTPAESNFRLAIMKKLAVEYGLKELRSSVLEAPPQTNTPLKLARREAPNREHTPGSPR
jgi:hypothetical protein